MHVFFPYDKPFSNMDILFFREMFIILIFCFDVETRVFICRTTLFASLLLSSNKQLSLDINLKMKFDVIEKF